MQFCSTVCASGVRTWGLYYPVLNSGSWFSDTMAWSSSVDWKEKKIVKRRKKRHLPVLFSFELCTKTPGHPSVALAGPLSHMESLGMHHLGSGGWRKLSFFGKASCSVVEVKSTTPKSSWTSPENQQSSTGTELYSLQNTFMYIFSLDLYKTSVNCSKQDKGNLESLNDSKMADNNNILDDIWGQ